MKHLIVTASDSNFGDFLIGQWLKSLKDNVNLNNIDILVLDYGLTKLQIKKLKKENVLLKKCLRNGHVVTLRYRDTAIFLRRAKYDQILFIDSGDIIFQDDFNKILEVDKTSFRASFENFNIVGFHKVFTKGFFKKDLVKEIKLLLNDKPMINGGVILGPSKKFKNLCEECYNMISEKNKFGPDQVAVNYILYRDGFNLIEEGYNYVITTAKKDFILNDGAFYFKYGGKIPIVHNTGAISIFRPIRNFGYGKDKNQINYISFYILRTLGKVSKLLALN